MPIILKIVLGAGGRALLNYISQIYKAPVHHPHNNPEIYEHIHLTNANWHPSRRSEPAARISNLPQLHKRDVVLNTINTRSAREPAGPKSVGELLLQSDALPYLVDRQADDAQRMRRPSNWPDPAAGEKSKPGGGLLKKSSAPPTFSSFAGTTPREIAAEFGALRKLKPNLVKAVGHLILSPGPQDRMLSKREWKKALEIALAEHGATDAPYAAWIHDDTEHQHLHIFFSRILLSGQVISDSHSFRKNRLASRKIEQELQLIPFSETPNPRAPGDGAALNNAVRSAERRGDAVVDAALARSALQQSRSRAEYYANLRAAGIEMDYAIRGQKNEIFGSSMRVIGSETWIKSSTIAKDLSWPKVKGRFPESDWFLESNSDSAEKGQVAHIDEVTQIAPEASPASRATRLDLDRMPAVARNILSPAEKELEETVLGGVSRRLGELTEQQQGGSPLVITGLLVARLSVACAELSLAAARALINFIIRLLRAFGLAIRTAETQVATELITPAAPVQLAPAKPAALQAFRLPDQVARDVDADAAATIEHVLNCVQTGRHNDLPDVGDDGEREALVAALEADSKSSTGANGTAAASTPTQEQGSFEPLYAAVRAYSAARRAVDDAWPMESVEVRNARVRVGIANQNLLKAQTAFQREHPIRFAAGRMKSATAVEAAAVATASAALAVAAKNFPDTKAPSLVIDVAQKRERVRDLATEVLQLFKQKLPKLQDKTIARKAESAILALEVAIGEFRTGLGEDAISATAKDALLVVRQAVSDDLSKSRRRDIEARLQAAAVRSETDPDDGGDQEEEQPKG